MITKEQHAQKHQTEIDALTCEIEKLEVEIKEAQANAERESDNKDHLLVLCQHRDEVKTKLAEIQAAGNDGWKDLKDSLDHTWLSLKNGFTKITSRFTA